MRRWDYFLRILPTRYRASFAQVGCKEAWVARAGDTVSPWVHFLQQRATQGSQPHLVHRSRPYCKCLG